MKVGDEAPHFVLKDSHGDEWSLAEQRGKTVVLFFYPGDEAPVCTKQFCSIRDNWENYKATGAEVIGISIDSVNSHKTFADKYSLPLRLLSDDKGKVVQLYEVKSWFSNRSARAVVVIDKNGVVRHHRVLPLRVFRPKDEDILKVIMDCQ